MKWTITFIIKFPIWDRNLICSKLNGLLCSVVYDYRLVKYGCVITCDLYKLFQLREHNSWTNMLYATVILLSYNLFQLYRFKYLRVCQLFEVVVFRTRHHYVESLTVSFFVWYEHSWTKECLCNSLVTKNALLWTYVREWTNVDCESSQRY